MELAGKVAVVTGAGSGIGKATAILFAQQGVRVGVLSRTAHEVEQTAAEIQQNGKEALALVADTTQENQMQQAVQPQILCMIETKTDAPGWKSGNGGTAPASRARRRLWARTSASCWSSRD